ncbi:MAG TPA: right-handed parallel beta-helix repeat-containing protein [Oculatellaceae cyanobacterium]|jgi:hypothetical protein
MFNFKTPNIARYLLLIFSCLGINQLNYFSKVNAAPLNHINQDLHLKIVVNSNEDIAIQPDAVLTLREAIALANGTLSINNLSQPEKAQVEQINSNLPSKIEFNLPTTNTIIRLNEELPHIHSPGLIIDGTTQPGYDNNRFANPDINIPTPIVEITPAAQVEIFRGLTIIADGVVIRGLSLHGFTAKHRDTVFTPAADIFIAYSLPQTQEKLNADQNIFPFDNTKDAPKNVLIENNWLGVQSKGKVLQQTSAFGVSVFNSLGTSIRKNLIANHDSSGIITSVNAENLQVSENVIIDNGFAGMPDAIRLEGKIKNSQISSNLICGNDGSAIFLFKPDGDVKISNNQIKFNGRKLRRAAIYLMGNNHQVISNEISNQTGAGVVVAAYPQSDRNIIQNNRFAAIAGLSIDLNTQQDLGVEQFQRGDGINPRRNSPNRRLDTANAAINAPEFMAKEFFVIDGKVNIDGIADPGSQIEIYKVTENTSNYGTLSEPIAMVNTDSKGKFSLSLSNLQPGEKISAIATDPKYGTSEPALNAVVNSIDGTIAPVNQSVPQTSSCSTAAYQNYN